MRYRYILILLFIFAFPTSLILSGRSMEDRHNGNIVSAEGFLNGRPRKNREVKIRKPRAVTRAEKEQKAKEKRLDKEYAEFVKASRKRAYDIQSPEVKERIKANRKETADNYKMKKKSNAKNTNKATRKYRGR